MPAGIPAGVKRTRHRAGLAGDVGSVWGRPEAGEGEMSSSEEKAMVSSSLASVASTLCSSCS